MDILKLAPKKKIMVIGDFGVDELIVGKMSKISREGPIPVIQTQEIIVHPGAAGNVAANIYSMGAQIIPVGIIGNDLYGQYLINYFKERSGSLGLFTQDRKTHVYRKVFGIVPHSFPQQIMRVDSNEKKPVDEKEIISKIEKLIPEADAVVVTDHEKGTITPKIIETVSSLSKKYNIPTIGDSRNKIGLFKNFSFLKPNDYETICAAENIRLGDEELELAIKDNKRLDKAASLLIKDLNVKAILLTRGEKGIKIYENSKDRIKITEVPTRKVEIYDITGAGDSTGAAISISLACGSSLVEAAKLGNLAGGIAVSHWGTYAVTSNDLKKATR